MFSLTEESEMLDGPRGLRNSAPQSHPGTQASSIFASFYLLSYCLHLQGKIDLLPLRAHSYPWEEEDKLEGKWHGVEIVHIITSAHRIGSHWEMQSLAEKPCAQLELRCSMTKKKTGY